MTYKTILSDLPTRFTRFYQIYQFPRIGISKLLPSCDPDTRDLIGWDTGRTDMRVNDSVAGSV